LAKRGSIGLPAEMQLPCYLELKLHLPHFWLLVADFIIDRIQIESDYLSMTAAMSFAFL
jgi:hypothetical protein